MFQFKEHADLGRSRNWRVQILRLTAKALGVTIHIDGMPYGSRRAGRPYPGNMSERWGGMTQQTPGSVAGKEAT